MYRPARCASRWKIACSNSGARLGHLLRCRPGAGPSSTSIMFYRRTRAQIWISWLALAVQQFQENHTELKLGKTWRSITDAPKALFLRNSFCLPACGALGAVLGLGSAEAEGL